MEVIKRVPKLIRSDLVGRQQNEVMDALVRPLNVIGFEIVKFPGHTMEAFGILFKIEISYSAKCHFFFEHQYTVFFENNQQRPDLDSLFKFCKEGFNDLSNVLSQEVKKHKIGLSGDRLGEFNGKELRILMEQELDRQYPM